METWENEFDNKFVAGFDKKKIEELMPKEKEIRYEELDTGIGIDKLEYAGQDFEHGYNQYRKEMLELLNNKNI